MRVKALEKFLSSIKQNPERYKTASATSIPFPDNFFDMAFSANTVSVYLNIDRVIFKRATEEALRVLKPGGKLQFFPFQESEPGWDAELNAFRLANDRYLVRFLMQNPIVANVSTEIYGNDRERLVVIKPKQFGDGPRRD